MAIIINGQGRVGVRVTTPSGGGGGTDADAQAFITAAGITDSTQQTAINTLVTDLKTAGIWTKMKALYPFVGGDAAKHSYNLVNTSLYQLAFSSGWIHSSNGATPNGLAYADTGYNMNTSGSLDDAHLSFYSRTNNFAGYCLMGCYQAPSRTAIYNSTHNAINASAWSNLLGTTNGLGLYVTSRINNTQNIVFKDSARTDTLSSSFKPNNNIQLSRLGGYNGDYSINQCAFASIGLGLNTSEIALLNTAVQAFQTTLGRQV